MSPMDTAEFNIVFYGQKDYFDATKSLIIRVNLLARKSTEEEIEQYLGCLGLLIQYKNYTNRKVNLQM